MDGIERLLSELQTQLIGDGTIKEWESSPLLEEHELLQASFAFLSKRENLKPYLPKLYPLKSGAVPLFHKSFFPWGALPYPKEHAELGTLLACLENPEIKEIARQMIPFQEASLAHDRTSLAALFRQEKCGSPQALSEANKLFFQCHALTPSEVFQFIDEELGMVSKRDQESTLVSVGSGCKSTMGAFLYKDSGILCYGPQTLTLGNCAAFGLAGKGQKIRLQDEKSYFSLSYQCRLAASSLRKCSLTQIEDSGYSALWIEAAIEGGLEGIALRCRFEGMAKETLHFSFFGKGRVCTISSLHQLRPRSLDRYQGPPDTLVFSGIEGSVRIDPLEGSSHLEVIPLAGDESFWGADFLATYTLSVPETAFVIQRDP